MAINLSSLKPDIRYLKDLLNVAYDRGFVEKSPNFELYYMYRGIEEKDGIRYDITIVPANLLGVEFTKTKGHYHGGSFGEIYTVLEGEAIYLMQKRGENGIEDAYAVKASKGDFIIIPAGYGHITINPADAELKMANWVSIDCKSDYSDYEKNQGGCWYYTVNGWIKNGKYGNVPELRFEEPAKSLPENLDFLKIG